MKFKKGFDFHAGDKFLMEFGFSIIEFEVVFISPNKKYLKLRTSDNFEKWISVKETHKKIRDFTRHE
jgi:hypothetical protein